ncbi:hypothetical protein V9T40_002669 [Parthenolecanium corni]|uniref:Uncharacterized protein n=1 Tax=Parthenolecanium corni TaxID=536013 RepID=A0AAN9TIW4_9HEMI
MEWHPLLNSYLIIKKEALESNEKVAAVLNHEDAYSQAAGSVTVKNEASYNSKIVMNYMRSGLMETQNSAEFGSGASQKLQIPDAVSNIYVKVLKFLPGSAPSEKYYVFNLDLPMPVHRSYVVRGTMENSTYEDITPV